MVLQELVGHTSPKEASTKLSNAIAIPATSSFVELKIHRLTLEQDDSSVSLTNPWNRRIGNVESRPGPPPEIPER